MKRRFVFMCLFAFMVPAMAQGVSVKNEISVEASTGGNSATNAQQGKSVAEVFVRTTVDGEVVQETQERKEQEGGSVSIEREIRYESEAAVGESAGKVEYGQEREGEQYQEVEETGKNQVEESKPFVAKILAFFRGIFARWFS